MKYKPMLATTFKGDLRNVRNALYEIKYDGMRIISENNGSSLGGVLWARSGEHKNNQFPELVDQIKTQDQCTLDGELVIFNENGVSDFTLLQKRAKIDNPLLIKTKKLKYPATYMVFDILTHNGKDLTQLPQTERKTILKNVLHETENIKYTEFFDSPDGLLGKNIEGIMIKKKDAPYILDKRTDHWLKYKFNQEGVFHVVDYEQHPSGIVMITKEGHRVNCNGKNAQYAINKLNEKIEFDIEVTYLEITQSGELRFPSFKRYVRN